MIEFNFSEFLSIIIIQQKLKVIIKTKSIKYNDYLEKKIVELLEKFGDDLKDYSENIGVIPGNFIPEI